jgi:hypothetical protein
MAGILRLSSIEIGESAIIALINPVGKIKASRLPDKPNDVQFVLADGRTAYFPLFIADKFREAGVQARVPFEITRLGVHDVRIRSLAAERSAERDYRDAQDYAPEPAYDLPAASGCSQPCQPATAAPLTDPTDPACAKFMGAYKTAIDILLESQVYAKRLGLLMEVHCEDVRCLAATIMIGSQR